MGRQRIKHKSNLEVEPAAGSGMLQRCNEEGLYSITNVIRWKPRTGKDAGKLVRLNLDEQIAHHFEARSGRGADSRYFYSKYYSTYPWAVKLMAQALNTWCLNCRCSRAEGSYTRAAIGIFFEFCAKFKIKLDGIDALDYGVMCRWRQHLRSVKQQSRYKSSQFRRVCRVLEAVMGTSIFPTKFSMPVYSSDAPTHLSPYSDSVMYQLIAAAVSDINRTMHDWPMPNVEDPNYPGLISRFVGPVRSNLFAFFLFFIISCGSNKETVCSWRRVYSVAGKNISPIDWTDPLDPNKCRLRGWKIRGKQSGKYSYEDVWINKLSGGVFPLLRYLLWYTAPLVKDAEECSKHSLWLYKAKDKVWDFKFVNFFQAGAAYFLRRHAIWETDSSYYDGIIKKRLTTLDSRRFRKVYASNEFIKAIEGADNYEALASELSTAMHHKEFDTTLGSYLALGKPKELIDLAIITLQNGYVEAAKKFRGHRVKGEITTERPGFYSGCIDPTTPDYEGSEASGGIVCNDYDMCMGCTKSRVFSIHLPRIAARIIQYEKAQLEMSKISWNEVYGRKHARACDVLEGWSNKVEVDAAWVQAKNGQVYLPELVFFE